jgi:flagellar biosynthesis protein FliR
MSIGLSSALAGPVDDSEPLPAITSLITLTATALIFLRICIGNSARDCGFLFGAAGIGNIRCAIRSCSSDRLFDKVIPRSLRISSPFITYALITNFVIGLAGKLVPQIPLYFITVPAMIVGGLFLFYTICTPFMQIFNAAVSKWLVDG